MFEIKLRAWKDSLDAHRVMEAFMTEKMDEQYALIDSLQEKWHGAAANMFRERYLYMLRNGKYAKVYRRIRSIRQMMEDYLPKLVNLTSKCEQLPEQLDYDYYSAPWNIFNENIYYNAGYLYLDIDYKGNIDFLCDEIHEKNQAARNLLDDIMDECSDLINFSEEREWNAQAFRKISRVQNFRLAFDEFATEVERLDEEMAEYFQYITASNQDEQEKRTVAGTAQPQAEIEKVQMVEPKLESGWDALVEGFMDSWLGESITAVSTAANPFLSQALIYKTAIDMKCRNMTLEESLAETGEFAKGYVQSVPKVAGEMAEGIVKLPVAIKELPSSISELWKLIDEYGIKAVADGILESTEESIKRVWNEEVVHGTARTRGEVTGRAVIAVAELALSVKGLADWLSKGKKVATQTDEIIAGIEKVEDVIDETGEVSTDVKQASKVMDEIQDTVDDVKPVGNSIGTGGKNAFDSLDTQTIRTIKECISQKGLTEEEFLQLMAKSSDEMSRSEAKIMEYIRDNVPFPDETTPLQKVINPKYIDSYLDGSFTNFNDGKISGCIATAEDVTGLTTPQSVYEGLRLDYENTPFSPADSSVTVIRFTSNDVDKIIVPYGDKMPNPAGGNVSTMTPPFTGNGFTASTTGQVIPEFYSEGLSLNNGAQMIEITDAGEEILKAVYDEDLQRFVLVD